MFKIGDYITTFSDTSVPTNPFGRCKYCNNISRPTKEQGLTFRGQELTLKDLCDENWNQDCPWCAILARCIQMLEPETSKMVEANPDRQVWCVINRYNAISICWNYTSNVRIIERNSFQLYRSPSPVPLPHGLDIPTCPELAPEPGHELMWDYLRQCLMQCLWSHSECRKAQQLDWYPKRLLYLENSGGVYSNMRVVQTDEHHPSGPYIALSHCWGAVQPLQSLTTNISTFQQHIDYDQLSAVFQNCVTAAKMFGVNYVWIDSLCIIQDDRADWTAHARQMDLIFENAIIVVAAVSSEDGSVPFLGPKAPNERHLRTSHPVEPSALPSTLGSVRARRYLSTSADLTDFQGPLRSRAWAWQEHVLSTRIIHFTEVQTVWECLQARGSEMMGSLQPRSDSMKTRMGDVESGVENLVNVWQHAVNQYGARSLTYPTDRLPAFSGVAARFQPLFNTQYCAGLWRHRMVLDLAWERSEKLTMLTTALSPPPANSVPSWSWASIGASALYGLEGYFREATVMCSVTAVDCEPSTDNPLGEVRQGSSVQFEGMYVTARLITDERGFAVVVKDGFEPQRVTTDCRLIEAIRTVDGTEIGTVRRTLPSEVFDPEEAKKPVGEAEQETMSGAVFCLLLHAGILWEGDTECAIVLILAPLGGDPHTVQRVALGRGGPDKLDEGRNSIPWQWTSYEAWENWEALFDGAQLSTFTVF